MHELSLADEIVRMVQAAAVRDAFAQVATLRLEVGALAGVDGGALRFALEAISTGTCLAGAVIEISEPPGVARCTRCAQTVMIDSRADPCPACGGYPVQVLSGGALRVLEVLVLNE